MITANEAFELYKSSEGRFLELISSIEEKIKSAAIEGRTSMFYKFTRTQVDLLPRTSRQLEKFSYLIIDSGHRYDTDGSITIEIRWGHKT